MDNAFQYIMDNGGVDSDDDYTYTATEADCWTNATSRVMATVDSFLDVTPGSEDQLAAAALTQPISIAIEADQVSQRQPLLAAQSELYIVHIVTRSLLLTQLSLPPPPSPRRASRAIRAAFTTTLGAVQTLITASSSSASRPTRTSSRTLGRPRGATKDTFK